MDALIVLVAMGMFLGIFHYLAGGIILTRPAMLSYTAAFALMLLLYKALALLYSDGTPGTKLMDLRLLDFDGRPPDRRQRFHRLAASCLSLLPAGAGLLWALLDEEQLTWHDHMSKTFATPRELHR